MNLLKNMVWSPVDYAEVSVLAREVGEEMLSRLDWMTIKPSVMVDLGCGSGEMSARLQERFTDAHVVALDLSEEMIRHTKQRDAQRSCICADATRLPLKDQSVDLLFSNLLFPWQDKIEILLRECHRVLRPEGVLMLTALGPDTLKEWQSILKQDIVPAFVDMHDMGDLMLSLKYAGPVLDVHHYTMTYRTQKQLLQELQTTGMLMAGTEISGSENMMRSEEESWEVTYEVIFAHAFREAESETTEASADGSVHIPLSHLKRQLRS